MKKKKTFAGKVQSNIIILVAFVAVIICCMNILRSILWKNTNEMGLALVENYSAGEEKNINAFEVILNICTNYIAEREKSGISHAELKEGLYLFMNGLTDVYGKENIRIYGMSMASGSLVSNTPEIEAMSDYDIMATDWYRKAAASAGEICFSPAYPDALTGSVVVTMCRVIPETGSFLAIDMKPACFEVENREMALPNKASYYLVDSEGKLLYYLSSWDYGREEFQRLVDGYRENAVCGAKNHVTENVKASDGIVRNVFFHHMDNGWTGILTMPRDEILSGVNIFRNVSAVLIGLGLVLVIFQIIREYRNRKREEQYLVYQKAMNSTVHAYRAIYYIDIKKGSCDTVYPLGADGKPRHSTYSEEVQDRLRYGVVAEEHCEQVFEFLDLSNIEKQLSEKEYIELQFKRSRFDVNSRTVEEGGYEWCSIAVTVAEKKDGELISITMAIRNVDDVIQREEKQREMLSLAVARAEAASRAKSDFLSRMSHDIRTPMNAIMGMTAVAAMHIDEKKRVMDALEKITVSGKHLLGLINEVLDMSRIESGKVSLTEECFNLSDTIENFLTVFHSQIEAKELGLNVNIAKLEHENVIGDEQHLQQIFMNIMGNAVRFTPPGGSISIHIEEKPSHFADRGCYEFTLKIPGSAWSRVI